MSDDGKGYCPVHKYRSFVVKQWISSKRHKPRALLKCRHVVPMPTYMVRK